MVLSSENRDLARGPIHSDAIAGLDLVCAEAGAGHGRDAVLSADDRRVAHHSADVGHACLDFREDRGPTRSGYRCDEDLVLLEIVHLFGIVDDSRDAFDGPR